MGAIKIEPKVGAMLPCNVIIRQIDEGIEVSAIDPVASMIAIDSVELKSIAEKVREMLSAMLDLI